MAYILDYDLSWDSQNRQVNLFKNPKITVSVREGSHLIMKNINKYRRDYPVKELIYCPLSKDIENVSNIDSLNKNYHIYCLVEKTGGLKPKDFFLVSKYNGSIYDWVNKDGSLRFSEINQ